MAKLLVRRAAIVALCAGLYLLAGNGLANALPTDLPLRRGTEAAADGGLWVPVFLLLGMALGAAAYVARRRGWLGRNRTAARRAEHALTRVSSHALTPQASVHVVQWNGDEYLVGCTPQHVTLLARRAGGSAGEARP